MTSIFCCASIQPYRPRRIIHEDKFTIFIGWAAFPRESSPDNSTQDHFSPTPPFAIQLVRQVNFGPLEAKRYFVPQAGQDAGFVEVQEQALIEANFEKLNAHVLHITLFIGHRLLTRCRYKNWKCNEHNKFFEVNVYQKNPTNLHHWRVNIARPANEIDL